RDVIIRCCHVTMRDLSSPWPGIFFQGDDALIERNEIRVDTRAFLQRAVALSAVVASAALGGLQIGGGSERVRILDNLIEGGIGNGITLGSVRIVNSDGIDI